MAITRFTTCDFCGEIADERENESTFHRFSANLRTAGAVKQQVFACSSLDVCSACLQGLGFGSFFKALQNRLDIQEGA